MLKTTETVYTTALESLEESFAFFGASILTACQISLPVKGAIYTCPTNPWDSYLIGSYLTRVIR
jgi:hypothetical protein